MARRRRKTEPVSQVAAAEELDLLQSVVAGNQHAWVDFCNRYENFVGGCVARVLRRYAVQLTAESLDDLVAEVWVALLRDDCRKLRVFDPKRGCRLTTWIGMIATNTVIDYLRVHHTPNTYLEDRPQIKAELIDADRPDLHVEQVQRIALARKALGALKTDEQRFMQYCFAEEMRPEKIAEAMGISINTVHSRKFKLRQKLTRMVMRLCPA